MKFNLLKLKFKPFIIYFSLIPLIIPPTAHMKECQVLSVRPGQPACSLNKRAMH